MDTLEGMNMDEGLDAYLTQMLTSSPEMEGYITDTDVESLDAMISYEDLEVECDICGNKMNYEYGKLVCPVCGYVKEP